MSDEIASAVARDQAAAQSAGDVAWGPRPDSQWVVRVDRFGTLFADGEQIHLPGPVVGIEAERELAGYFGPKGELQPMPWPEYSLKVLLRPTPYARITVFDDGRGRVHDIHGDAWRTWCPTCGTPFHR